MTEALSYVHGAMDVPLLGETLGRSFERTVARWGNRPGLVVRSQGVRWTYAELDARAEAFAAGLLALGVEPGDRVGVWSLNNAEWLVTQIATAKAGIILVNINPAYRVTELEYALNKVGVRALVTATAFKTSDYMGMLREVIPELAGSQPGHLRSARVPSLRIVIQIGGASAGTIGFDGVAELAGAAERARLAALRDTLQFDDPINIQFTSGTTGNPKGTTLTHHNVLNNGFFIGEAMRLTAEDRLCIPVPLYHCFGMVLGNLAAITHGACMVYPGEGFDPLAVLETVAEERCTGLHGVPTMFIAEMEHPRFAEFDLSSLRTGIMAGSPCPIEVMRRAVDRMHLRDITICYGMTETSPVSFQTTADDPLERRVSTVGRVHPHLEVKIVDAEGRIVPRGVPGELCTRGYSVMLGYWDDQPRTEQAIDAARWMHTGDLAVIDAEGYCNIVGRLKDVVIRGGENVFPREVEEYLYGHPAILDVQCFGVADPRYGEELCAWVKRRPGSGLTEDDVRAYCRGKIAHQKVPRYVKFVDEFPMTVTGKMQKFLMRQAMEQELGVVASVTA
ncbi:AMP-binding protein [Acidisphaera sp. L21]|uniref:AMP-binding protein n=1 Tax=Acidisphaera sp. L21 TaxID=1641851 RepID=UPI001C20AACB|nr:AMP-binding protein [Acidisphaera sp. L21]